MYHPLVQQIQDLLTKHNFWFETFQHAEVRTSKEAASLRVGYGIEQGSKALLIKTKLRGGGSGFIMCVLPGDQRINGKRVREISGAIEIRFATEKEIDELVKDLVPGAVPPFGNLFGLLVYVDKSLLANEKIIFNAGDRKFSIGMYLKDYLEIVSPTVADFVEK